MPQCGNLSGLITIIFYLRSMQRTLLHLIIQLLVAAIVSIGITHADVDLCRPDCNHCGVITAASPCCDNMSADEVAATVPVKTGHRSDCTHGSFCDAVASKNDLLPVHHVVETDFATITPVRVVLVPDLPIR